MTDDVEAWEDHLMGELNRAIEDRNAAEAEVERLREALRLACEDGWADGEAAMAAYLSDADDRSVD